MSQLSVNSVGGEGTIHPQGDEEPAILIVVVMVWLECGTLDEHLNRKNLALAQTREQQQGGGG